MKTPSIHDNIKLKQMERKKSLSLFKTQVVAKASGNHVNNVMYLEYLEIARRELYAHCISLGVEAMVAHIRADYKKEVFNRETLTIHSTIEKVGNTSITLKQEMLTEGGELAVSATVVLVTVNQQSRQKVRVPDEIRELNKQNVIHSN